MLKIVHIHFGVIKVFLIINEFSLKSPIPPLFNIFHYLFAIFRHFIKFIRKSFIYIRQRFSKDNISINNQDKYSINPIKFIKISNPMSFVG
jgi:hypothetical protein